MVSKNFLKTRHRRIPGIESVTLTRDVDSSSVTGVDAERRPLNRSSSGSVDMVTDELEFILADVTCGGTPPKTGDVITDADSKGYTILSVHTELLGTRHRCRVVKRKG